MACIHRFSKSREMNRLVHITYCITRSDTIGGAHVHVADMAAWMRASGHEAEVIVGGEGPYCDHLAAKDVPYTISESLCRPIDPRRDVRAVAELRRIFRQARPDLVSLHSAKAGLLGRLATVGLRLPVVFTAHGWAFTDGVSRSRARVFRLLERAVAPLADRIITVSGFDRSLALDAGVGSPGRLVTVHNAMPDQAGMASAGEDVNPVRLTMVARLDQQKDHETLLQALQSLGTDRPWVLDLVGDGPDEAVLRERVRTLGLEDRVQFLGLRDDVAEILAATHVFVLASRWEGFPRSILEAMRAGLPVIASDVGGVSESVEDDHTGYLIQRGDTDRLRDRLAYLIDRPDERARLGGAGRARFEDRFRFERMAAETMAVYEAVLRGRACASA